MKTKTPPLRRRFAGAWDEIEYLYDKLLFWFHQRENPGKAVRYGERLSRLLSKADPKHEAILGEECWSLIHEARGDLTKAIEFRENEIRLMRRLHELVRDTPGEATAMEGRGHEDLSDRLDLLAALYHANGELDRAIGVLKESRAICARHGIRFDGGDLLADYLREKRTPSVNDRPIRSDVRRRII